METKQVGRKARFDVFYQVQEYQGGSLLVVHGWKRETVRLYLLEVMSECVNRGLRTDERHQFWSFVGKGWYSAWVGACPQQVVDVCGRVKFGHSWRGVAW